MPAVVSDERPVYNISANLIAIRKIAGLAPRFVQLYLTSNLGNRQIARLQSGQVHSKITTDDVASVLIPNVENQTDLVARLDAARAERSMKLGEADELLGGLDDFLFTTLGLNVPPRDERKVFAMKSAEVSARFDPHFFLPALLQNSRMLAAAGAVPLGSLVSFSNEIWKPAEHNQPTFCYVEISTVNRQTGEARAVATPVTEAPSRARMALRTGSPTQ